MSARGRESVPDGLGRPPYDAVLFDFDGVLADTEPVHCAAWAEVLRPFGLELTWEFYRHHGIGVTDRVMLEALIRHAGSSETADSLLERWRSKQEAFRQLVISAPPITQTIAEFVKSLLDVDLAVVTSSQTWEIEPPLIAAGIREGFGALVGAADVSRHKPAPDPYLEAARRLRSRRPLVVEDSVAGIASARAAGFDFVRVSGPGEVPELVGRALGLSGVCNFR